MPEIEIRPATSADIPALTAFEHAYKSAYVWQMDLAADEGQVRVNFREVRLPRQVTVEYPRSAHRLAEDFAQRELVLVAVLAGAPVAYLSLTEDLSPTTAWVTDLVVAPQYRRQGIATALIIAAQEWARARQDRRMILEMQSKNLPGIRLARKLGFDFCGYNDHYYSNQDIAVFFAQTIR